MNFYRVDDAYLLGKGTFNTPFQTKSIILDWRGKLRFYCTDLFDWDNFTIESIGDTIVLRKSPPGKGVFRSRRGADGYKVVQLDFDTVRHHVPLTHRTIYLEGVLCGDTLTLTPIPIPEPLEVANPVSCFTRKDDSKIWLASASGGVNSSGLRLSSRAATLFDMDSPYDVWYDFDNVIMRLVKSGGATRRFSYQRCCFVLPTPKLITQALTGGRHHCHCRLGSDGAIYVARPENPFWDSPNN